MEKAPKRGTPAFGELCEYITAEFGGPRQLAKAFKKAYDSCKEGSPAQVSLTHKICDLILRNSQLYTERTDVELQSDEDLEKWLIEKSGMLNKKGPFVEMDRVSRETTERT